MNIINSYIIILINFLILLTIFLKLIYFIIKLFSVYQYKKKKKTTKKTATILFSFKETIKLLNKE